MSGMTFDEWLMFGIGEGWVSQPVCEMHDGVPLMPEEEDALEDGWDPCIPVLRLWEHNIPPMVSE